MTLNLIAREFVGFERAFARQLAAYRVEHPQADMRFDYLDVPPLYTRMVEQRGALDGRHDLFLAVTDWLPLLMRDGLIVCLDDYSHSRRGRLLRGCDGVAGLVQRKPRLGGDSMELVGQVAIVTGAGRGIGRAIALELAGLGADIVIADLDRSTAEQTAGEVSQTGRRGSAVQADVTRATDRQAMVDNALQTFGRIDILVNNAGIYRTAPPLEITEDHWDSVMAVNARAVLFCCQAVLPSMLAAGRGVIVNVASMAGKVAVPTALPYAVSKAAVISLTRSLAAAYARNGVRVNCVCPGLVDTEMWKQIDREVGVGQLGKQPGEYWQERIATIPLGRAEQPEDVAHVVGFLASSKADYMTGQAINVTGGLIMH